MIINIKYNGNKITKNTNIEKTKWNTMNENTNKQNIKI